MSQQTSTIEAQAFDYVLGTLRGKERQMFEAQLKDNPTAQACVYFWEEKLMDLSSPGEVRPVDDRVWHAIAKEIEHPSYEKTAGVMGWFASYWTKGAFIAVALSVCLLAFTFMLQPNVNLPNADYVAVLSNEQGKPLLTALTTASGKKLWLKWGGIKVAPEKNVQLWAVSRRDGQIRSLAVFDKVDVQQLELTATHLHLIRDASYLLLTEEEMGGSSLDEPSSIQLAKGACVFLKEEKKSI